MEANRRLLGIPAGSPVKRLDPLFGAVLFVALAVLAIAGGVYSLEDGLPNSTIKNFWDSLWWAVGTVLRVGYGDHVPVSGAGKILSLILSVLGLIGGAAVAAKILSIALSKYLKPSDVFDVSSDLASASESRVDHIIICGWDGRAEHAVAAIVADGIPKEMVVVVTPRFARRSALTKIRGDSLSGVRFVEADYSDERILCQLGAARARRIFIFGSEAGEHSASHLPADLRAVKAAIHLSQMKVAAPVLVEIRDPHLVPYLEEAGVAEIKIRG